MQQDKPCQCVTSRMFPHRESKCSMRNNPATSLFSAASQATNGVSSFVASTTPRSTTPVNASSRVPGASAVKKSHTNSLMSPDEIKFANQSADSLQPKTRTDDHEEDDMAEALLAIAMMESQSQQKADDAQFHAESEWATSLATAHYDSSCTATPVHLADGSKSELLNGSNSFVQENQPHEGIATSEETAVYAVEVDPSKSVVENSRPVYALPCATQDLESLQLAQALQEIENTGHSPNTSVTAEVPTVVRNETRNNAPCDCVSSRLFPHRKYKCSLRNLTGVNHGTESVARSGDTVAINHDMTQSGNEKLPTSTNIEQFSSSLESAPENIESELDEATSSNNNTPNTGSRPCRCVSAAMFPHRANKCALFNTTHAGKAAVVTGVTQVGAAVNTVSGTKRIVNKENTEATEKNKTGKVKSQTTEELRVTELKRRQDLLNIPTNRVVRSFLHMAGVNIAFIGAVSVVFLVSFGLLGHILRMALQALRNALMRR